MTAEVAQQVQSSGELSVGDQIEAWHNGKLFHRGEVIRTVAATDLFWILDERHRNPAADRRRGPGHRAGGGPGSQERLRQARGRRRGTASAAGSGRPGCRR